ncbi:glutamate-5-semialdehyde dehydrogenase [Acutalibacter sp. JLR.KK004]|uniref:glutamate-5-semialdehyde dehydrogenase n=1 Tax=Acutalibacter sp. JLR.KK004 TaxID=3112622 RepID=UPI002FF4178F
MTKLEEMGALARKAARTLAVLGPEKEAALMKAAQALLAHEEEILIANREDLAAGEEKGLTPALLDRLRLTPERIASMAAAMEEVAKAADPIGQVLFGEKRPNGLEIQKITVPLGVVGIIYEARPNVTSDACALCLKAGNAVILRGGKEALCSNKAIVRVLCDALTGAGLPLGSLQLVEDPGREAARELMGLTAYLDVLIPRGGAGLIRAVKEQAKVPVIETGVGNCHVYVDESANLDMAAEIIFNAKTSRPSVCNAIETVLVHSAIADKALPLMARRLSQKQVELRGCPRVRAILPEALAATEEDWATEYLDYILAVKVVDSLEEALDHIAAYSSGHSECIVTESYANAQRFLQQADSAAVYVNASTRFTDGGEFGLGAEIGISTQKLHARGPMGLQALTSHKFLIRGSGQVR